MTKSNKKSLTVHTITSIGMVTAITCILAPLSIPIGPVPISLTSLVIYISLYVLGSKKAILSYFIYLLIGLSGIPVFSGYTSGFIKLAGPTGGYLIGFIPMIVLSGILIDKFTSTWWLCFLGMIAGTCICYLFGTLWLAFQANLNFKEALLAGVIPFIPGDLVKMIFAIYLGMNIKKRISKTQMTDTVLQKS